MSDPPATFGPLTIILYKAPESQLQQQVEMLVRITNHHDVERSVWSLGPVATFDLAFHNGPGDDYTVTVAVKGYQTCGGFVKADPKVHKTLPLLLVPDHPHFSFPDWASLKAKSPHTAGLLMLDGGEEAGQKRYVALQASQPAALASLFNLGAAMKQIGIGAGKTPLDFIRGICWDSSFAQDRFFGYADPTIIPMIRAAAAEGEFAEEKDCARFHPGSTCSYKQTEFDYSNVQLTFHEGDTKLIDGVLCVKIEPDMDLYKELLAHGLLEVVPNLSMHGLTNPAEVLALRWVDGSESDEPPFDPGYSMT